MDVLFHKAIAALASLYKLAEALKTKKKLAYAIAQNTKVIHDTLKTYKVVGNNPIHQQALKEISEIASRCNQILLSYSNQNIFSKTMNIIKAEKTVQILNKDFEQIGNSLLKLNFSISLESFQIQQTMLNHIVSLEESIQSLVEEIKNSSNNQDYSDELDKIRNYMKNDEAFQWWLSIYKGTYEVTRYQIKKDFKHTYCKDNQITNTEYLAQAFENNELFGKEAPPKVTAHEFDRFYRKIWLDDFLRQKFLKGENISSASIQKVKLYHSNSNVDTIISPAVDNNSTINNSYGITDEKTQEENNSEEKQKKDSIEKFEGDIVDGLKEGWGKCWYIKGDYYEGNFLKDKKSGEGTYNFKIGYKYQGIWAEGKMNGLGKFNWSETCYYEGNFANNKKNGYGKMFKNGCCTFEGNMKDNLPDDQCKSILPNGDQFEGLFKDGKIAQGKLIKFKGEIAVGEFKNGKLDGIGKLTKPTGYIYEGEFRNGTLNGKGKIVYPSGSKYEGEVEDNQPNGQGKMNYSNKCIYEGEFKNCKKDGKGIFIFSTNTKYVGQFKNDSVDGIGEIFYTSGNYYNGICLNGFKNGKGTFQLKNGDNFEGTYINDKLNGFAICKYANGDCFEGHYFEEFRTGKGKLTQKDGTIREGEWWKGFMHGQCSIMRTDGWIYTGECFKGVRSGKGTLITKEFTYDGDWFNDFYFGKGILQYKSGAKIQGEFNKTLILNVQYNYVVNNLNRLYTGDMLFIAGVAKFHGDGKVQILGGKCFSGRFDKGEFIEGDVIEPDGKKIHFKKT